MSPRRPFALLLALLLPAGCALDPAVSTRPTAVTDPPQQVAAPPVAQTRPSPSGAGVSLSSQRLDKAALQGLLGDVRGEASIPGMIVGVSTPTDRWIGAAGTRGAEGTSPVSGTERSNVGSVSKTFATTIILQLAGEGRLSLDDPIQKYVPDVPNGTATLRQLGMMRSGLPSYDDDDAIYTELTRDHAHYFGSAELLRLIRRVQPIAAPGQVYRYSNTNITLLGMVIEKVTGKPYAQVVDERITGPLGLSHTSVGTACSTSPCLAGIADLRPSGPVTGDVSRWDISMYGASGNITSTVDDMLLWGAALGTGDGLLTPSQQTERMGGIDMAIPGFRPGSGYGFGLKRRGNWVGHDGLIMGYSTWVAYNTKTHTTIVIMVNSSIFGTAVAPADYVFLRYASLLGE